MSPLEFSLALILLLATPGPTNTLMALAGYQRGLRRALPLMGAELAGYLSVIVPVATLAAPLFDHWPMLALWTKLVAGGWVLFLSVKLWSISPTSGGTRQIDWRSVYVTTCLNPKALIIGLVIMPKEDFPGLLPWFGLFCLLVCSAATGWVLFGAFLGRSRLDQGRPAILHRVAAAGLFIFAMILAGTSLKALA